MPILERFRFQLSKQEMKELVAKYDRFKNLKHSSSPPYAFTEQGISMLSATIHSRYYEPFQTDLKKHNEQYREVQFIQLPQKNHDRFLIIDDGVYLLGASVKDMGVGMCAVTKMLVSPETIFALLK